MTSEAFLALLERVVLEHTFPFETGGHCDMTPFTYVEFNLQLS